MKIIHCADIHLDSPMKRLESGEKRSERKAELIKAFTEMVKYAKTEDVKAIIIAGDLFDQSRVSAGARNAVLTAIRDNENIDFYYLKGNHDASDILASSEDIPENLHTFTDRWKSIDLGENVVLTAAELTAENVGKISSELNLDLSHFNIVSLHGQDTFAAARDNAQIININEYKNKNIDYLALGHVHSYKCEKLDGRGCYCYPGCLEARGFDETGEHGFMLLDIDGEKRTFTKTLIKKPIRSCRILPVDISELKNTAEIIKRIKEGLAKAGYPDRDLVKIELTGEVDYECDKNLASIEIEFRDRFYDFKLKDLSGYKVDYDKYKMEESLKGEFIRTVQGAEDLSDEDKAEIIRIGIRTLMGEEAD